MEETTMKAEDQSGKPMTLQQIDAEIRQLETQYNNAVQQLNSLKQLLSNNGTAQNMRSWKGWINASNMKSRLFGGTVIKEKEGGEGEAEDAQYEEVNEAVGGEFNTIRTKAYALLTDVKELSKQDKNFAQNAKLLQARLQKLSQDINKQLNSQTSIQQMLDKNAVFLQNCDKQVVAVDAFFNDYTQSLNIDTKYLDDASIKELMDGCTDYQKLYVFYTKFANPSEDVKEYYKKCVTDILERYDETELASFAKMSKGQDPVVMGIIKDKAKEMADTEDIQGLLQQYADYHNAGFPKGKELVLESIKNIINSADTDKLKSLCADMNSAGLQIPSDVVGVLKAKVTNLIQTAGTPAKLQELYSAMDDPDIKAIVPAAFVKPLFTQQVEHLIDAALEQNYQSGQDFEPKLLEKQLKELQQKLNDYQCLPQEFAVIAVRKFRNAVATIIDENELSVTIGTDAPAVKQAIDQALAQLKTVTVQNRLYEDSLRSKWTNFTSLNFISPRTKNGVQSAMDNEPDSKQVIKILDEAVSQGYQDLTKNVKAITGQTKLEIDLQLSNGAMNNYQEVLTKSDAALDAIKNDIARIVQDPTLNELFDGIVDIDNIENLEKASLQRLSMQLADVIRDANNQIKKITDEFVEQIGDLESVAPLKDLSADSLQTLKTSLDQLKQSVQEYQKEKIEAINEKEEEREDGTKEIPDEIANDLEVQERKNAVLQLLNKKNITISSQGSAEFIKKTEMLDGYEKLIKKKIKEKQKKDEEDKKKKEELIQKKKEEREKKQKEKEQKAKEREEKKKFQQAKNTDLANENFVKKAYEDKQEQLNQFKKDNPEPAVNIGLCILTFILGVLPLFIYLASVSSDKKDYDAKINQKNKEVKEAKDVFDAKHRENMQKYNTPNSTRLVRNVSPEFNSQSSAKDVAQRQ